MKTVIKKPLTGLYEIWKELNTAICRKNSLELELLMERSGTTEIVPFFISQNLQSCFTPIIQLDSK